MREWDCYVEKLAKSSLPKESKAKAAEALNTVREYLGERWLPRATEEGHQIPSYWMSDFALEFTVEWLVDFARKLISLSPDGHFKELLGQIRSSKEYLSTEGVLDLASRMVLNGYKIELEPEVGQKKADIKLETREGPVYIEVKSLQTPKDEQESKEYQAWGYRMAGDLSSGLNGQLHKGLSEAHKKQVGEMIRSAAKNAKETGTPQEIFEDGVITAIIETDPSPTNVHLMKWLSERKLRIGFHGPSFDATERVHRIRSVMKSAKEQIPKDKPGIIVVYPHRLFQLYQEGPLGRIADPFEEDVYSQENIVAGVLIDRYLLTQPNMKDEIATESNYVMLKQIFYNALHENSLVIRNRFSPWFSVIKNPEEFFRRPSSSNSESLRDAFSGD